MIFSFIAAVVTGTATFIYADYVYKKRISNINSLSTERELELKLQIDELKSELAISKGRQCKGRCSAYRPKKNRRL